MLFNFMEAASHEIELLCDIRTTVDSEKNENEEVSLFSRPTVQVAAVVAAGAVSVVNRTEILKGSIQGFYANVIPAYSLDAFRSHFRMTRSSFEVLFQLSFVLSHLQKWKIVYCCDQSCSCVQNILSPV